MGFLKWSDDGITSLADRCDRVENAHATHRVDACVHVGPVFSGGANLLCPLLSNGTTNYCIRDYCVSVMAL